MATFIVSIHALLLFLDSKHRRNLPQHSTCSASHPTAQRLCGCDVDPRCPQDAGESSEGYSCSLLSSLQYDDAPVLLSRRLGASTTASQTPTPTVSVTASVSPSTSPSPNPYAVSQISAGLDFVCLLMSATSGVRCFGDGYYGQLGTGGTYNLYSPPSVDVLTGVLSISAGGEGYICVLLTSSGVTCWGENLHGQLGTGNTNQFKSPPATSCMSGVSLNASGALSAGYSTTCVVTNTSGVICWGSNANGQIGNGYANSTSILSPPALPVLYGAVSVSVGYTHTCALMNTTGLR